MPSSTLLPTCPAASSSQRAQQLHPPPNGRLTAAIRLAASSSVMARCSETSNGICISSGIQDTPTRGHAGLGGWVGAQFVMAPRFAAPLYICLGGFSAVSRNISHCIPSSTCCCCWTPVLSAFNLLPPPQCPHPPRWSPRRRRPRRRPAPPASRPPSASSCPFRPADEKLRHQLARAKKKLRHQLASRKPATPAVPKSQIPSRTVLETECVGSSQAPGFAASQKGCPRATSGPDEFHRAAGEDSPLPACFARSCIKKG